MDKHGTIWRHTVLRAVRRSRARGDIQRRSRLRVVHSYCLCIWNFATLPPFYWCATAGPRACSLLETVHSRIRGLHTWTVWVVSLTDGTMVACAIIVCTLVGGRRPANGTGLVPRVRAHSIIMGGLAQVCACKGCTWHFGHRALTHSWPSVRWRVCATSAR